MEFKDQKFSNIELVLDGNQYFDCSFDKCKIVFRGGDLPTIHSCNFQECNWEFEEAAERTLLFMKMLYHGMGSNGPELVETTIRLIRQPFA